MLGLKATASSRFSLREVQTLHRGGGGEKGEEKGNERSTIMVFTLCWCVTERGAFPEITLSGRATVTAWVLFCGAAVVYLACSAVLPVE